MSLHHETIFAHLYLVSYMGMNMQTVRIMQVSINHLRLDTPVSFLDYFYKLSLVSRPFSLASQARKASSKI